MASGTSLSFVPIKINSNGDPNYYNINSAKFIFTKQCTEIDLHYNVTECDEITNFQNFIEEKVKEIASNFDAEDFLKKNMSSLDKKTNPTYFTLVINENYITFKSNKNEYDKLNKEKHIFLKNPKRLNKYHYVNIEAIKEFDNNVKYLKPIKAIIKDTQPKTKNKNNKLSKKINGNPKQFPNSYNMNNQPQGNYKGGNPSNFRGGNPSNFRGANPKNFRGGNSGNSRGGNPRNNGWGNPGNFRGGNPENFRGGNQGSYKGNPGGHRGGRNNYSSRSNSANKNYASNQNYFPYNNLNNKNYNYNYNNGLPYNKSNNNPNYLN